MSKIEWTNETWNPIVGCRPVSPGCENSYAETRAKRTAQMQPNGPYPDVVKHDRGEPLPLWNGKAIFLPDRLDKPLRWRKPRMVFVNSMSDLFHKDVTDEKIAAVFCSMAAAPRHTFQVLTKRPERMREWFDWIGRQAKGHKTSVKWHEVLLLLSQVWASASPAKTISAPTSQSRVCSSALRLFAG